MKVSNHWSAMLEKSNALVRAKELNGGVECGVFDVVVWRMTLVALSSRLGRRRICICMNLRLKDTVLMLCRRSEMDTRTGD